MRRFTIMAATAAVAVGAVLGAAGVAGAAGSKGAALTPAQKTQAVGVWKKAQCASCHTLAAGGGQGTRGPNLDGLYFPVDDIIRQVTNGGGYMPSFKTILTGAQIKLLASWIDEVRQVKNPAAAATTTAAAKPAATTAKPAATTAAAPAITPAVKAMGVAAWKKAQCAACHTLAAGGGQGTRGPNLDGLYFPVDDIIRQVTNGGGYMPSFKTILTPAQIKAIAAWIDAVRQVKKP